MTTRNTEKKRLQLANQERFLKAYARAGTILQASKASGVSRTRFYEWQERDAQGFRERLEHARERYADKLERLMHERLVDPTGNRGSDVLLIFALKALRREKYGDNASADDETARELIRELRALQRRNREARRKAAIDVTVHSADDAEGQGDPA